MIKWLLKKFFAIQTLSIVIAAIFLVLSLFGASKIDIYEETNILILLLGLFFMFVFAASLIFIAFSLALNYESEKKQYNKEE